MTMVEATAVTPEGRITPEDSGLWSDEQIEPLRRIVQFAHSQNQKVAIQLAHAGRKASTVAPWLDMGAIATEAVGGWPHDVLAPSAVPYSDTFPKPKELDKAGIKRIVAAFVAATKRALQAGFDVIEIHNAHGVTGKPSRRRENEGKELRCSLEYRKDSDVVYTRGKDKT